MFDKEKVDEIRQAEQAWAGRQAAAPREPVVDPRGTDGVPVRPHGLYTPAHLADTGFDYLRDVGLPGEFPFTRGIYPSMYRGRAWTMRQYAGFGTAAETNHRFRFMAERGMGGMNVAIAWPNMWLSGSRFRKRSG